MMKKIIALVGFKGSGKDTVGNILKKDYGFQTTSFAKPLKSALCEMFDWQSSMLDGITPESRKWRETPDPFWSEHFGKPITPRFMMQQFGTEIVRNRLNNKFWTLRCRKELESTNSNIVVTDARFLNEINMVMELGGEIVWVRRDPLPDYFAQATFLNNQWSFVKPIIKPFLRKLIGVHASEREWIGTNFDRIILNNSSLEDLHNTVSNWMD